MSWYKKARRGRVCDWDRFFINRDYKVSASVDNDKDAEDKEVAVPEGADRTDKSKQ